MSTVTVNVNNREETIVINNVYDDYFSGKYYVVKSVKDGVVEKHMFNVDYIVHIHSEERKV